MDSIWTFLLFSGLLIVFSLIGAYLPRAKEMSVESIHLMIALSAGLFLGLLFIILIPEGLEECDEGDIQSHYAMMVLALGFIIVMVIESYVGHNGVHTHDIGHATLFIGLGIHAACDGLALAALFMAGEAVGVLATVGLCIHKFADLFSLSSATLLSNKDNKKAMSRLIAFSLITPISGLICFLIFSDLEVEGLLGIPLMIAAGTMAYVISCDILPECFHEGKNFRTVSMIILGIAVMAAFFVLFPHVH